MIAALAVAAGAAVGAPLRFWMSHLARERGRPPTHATLLVNVLGSFVLGWLVGAGVTGSALALLGVGFCGALTTFSTLALEIWEALAEDRRGEAVATVALSLTLGLAAAYAGLVLGS